MSECLLIFLHLCCYLLEIAMDDPTLLIHWLFSCLSLLVMGDRPGGRLPKQPINLGDYLAMAACLCCMVRLALIHVVLTCGTNNVPVAVRQTKVFTDEEIYRREIGRKFAIANRPRLLQFIVRFSCPDRRDLKVLCKMKLIFLQPLIPEIGPP